MRHRQPPPQGRRPTRTDTRQRCAAATPALVLALALAVALVLAQPRPAQARELAMDPADMVEVELASVGMDPLTQTPVVLLRDLEDGDLVAIVIGVNEARAILQALHGIEPPRPMTHDLMSNLLTELGATLERIFIDALVDHTYLGALELRLEGRDDPILVDTRPSDGMALALRAGARIFVAPDILEEARERDFEALPDDQVAAAVGITVVEISDDIRESLNLPDRPGVIVNQATGPGAEAGITAGAMILEVNGEPVDTPMEFLDQIRATPAGEDVRIRYWYDGQEAEVELEPAAPRQPRPERDEPRIQA